VVKFCAEAKSEALSADRPAGPTGLKLARRASYYDIPLQTGPFAADRPRLGRKAQSSWSEGPAINDIPLQTGPTGRNFWAADKRPADKRPSQTGLKGHILIITRSKWCWSARPRQAGQKCQLKMIFRCKRGPLRPTGRAWVDRPIFYIK
jgi:hypothetical protein